MKWDEQPPTRGDEVSNQGPYREELEVVEAKLRHMTKEKARAWQAFELTGDETRFTSEVKTIMSRTSISAGDTSQHPIGRYLTYRGR